MSPERHALTGTATLAIGGDDAPAWLSRLCCCGCGETVNVTRRRRSGKGMRTGEPFRYLPGHNVRIQQPFIVDEASGCWLWIAAKDRDGYGASYWDGKVRRAHRDYYERLVGPIPKGMVLDHRCPSGPNKACINPAHMAICTPEENTRRHFARMRALKGAADVR
ncbi:MAG: HNH endonuclease [Variibacter sp.]|nr:HNH endonuclease [Variibacter sp.]